jgi:hypothetical protein
MGLFPSSSPSGRRRRVVVVILVIGTLFSSWRALAGAGYLLRGWVVSGCGWQVGTHLLVPFPFPLLLWLLVVVGCCSHYRGRRCFPEGRGGGGVVGSG